MEKISAIICAYNEADTIQDVITTVCDYFFDEVIVVNDGSTDTTDSILKEMKDFYNFKYVVLPENKVSCCARVHLRRAGWKSSFGV